MSTTPQKEAALLASLEIERVCKAHNLPMIMILGCPETGETVRSSYRMIGEHNRNNREYMTTVTADYFKKLESLT